MELSRLLTAIIFVLAADFSSSMFSSLKEWLPSSSLLRYGVAVIDVDHDGKFEFMVAGYNGANSVLKYDEKDKKLVNIATKGSPYEALMDPNGQTLGLCACDIDGDGKEEIYVLNSGSYSGKTDYGDKIFKWVNGKYVNLYDIDENKELDARFFAGRSVGCLDRFGKGTYGFALATYAGNGGGKFGLIEMDTDKSDISAGKIVLKNVAPEAGIDKATGGRGIAVGPILNDKGWLDIFFDNEGYGNQGANFLFKNLGNGKFKDVAAEVGVADEYEPGRGVALADFNTDKKLDIIYGNWDGPHRLYIQTEDAQGNRKFVDQASSEMAEPSTVRTVMAADFDNDGNMEVLYNNINSYGQVPNRLFRVESQGPDKDVVITKLDIGDALEKDGYGTGGAYHDIDGDGYLEVLLAHGESKSQPITFYKVDEASRGSNRNWIRVYPKTKQEAPARGATVTLTTSKGDELLKVIDSGSGYLCQMEPIAHFGLNDASGTKIRVQWPDGKEHEQSLSADDQRTLINVKYPTSGSNASAATGTNYPSPLQQDPGNQQLPTDINSMWKTVENSKKKEISYDMYADYLKESFESDSLPLWSYGLEKLPKYILPLSSDFLSMKRRHAQETVRLMEREMRLRGRDEGETGRLEMNKLRMEYRKMRGDPAAYRTREIEMEDELNADIEAVGKAVYTSRQRNYSNKLSAEKMKRRLERFRRKGKKEKKV